MKNIIFKKNIERRFFFLSALKSISFGVLSWRLFDLQVIENKKYDNACKDLQNAIDKGFTVSYGQEVEDLQKEHCKK